MSAGLRVAPATGTSSKAPRRVVPESYFAKPRPRNSLLLVAYGLGFRFSPHGHARFEATARFTRQDWQTF